MNKTITTNNEPIPAGFFVRTTVFNLQLYILPECF